MNIASLLDTRTVICPLLVLNSSASSGSSLLLIILSSTSPASPLSPSSCRAHAVTPLAIADRSRNCFCSVLPAAASDGGGGSRFAGGRDRVASGDHPGEPGRG